MAAVTNKKKTRQAPKKNKKKNWWQRIGKESVALTVLTLLIYILLSAVLMDLNKIPHIAQAISTTKNINNERVDSNLPSHNIARIETVDNSNNEVLDERLGGVKLESRAWSSFGDGYSSTVYLDEGRTDMQLDENISALSFPPLYSFSLEETSLENSNFVEINLPSSLNNLDSLPKPLPRDLLGKNILAASISTLDEKKVASFLFKEGGEERVYAYFLNNNNKYNPIIDSKSKESIVTKHSKGGGRLAVGGDDNNFIILYSGYEGIAYHYLEGELYDISKFFKINAMDGGFLAHIFKQGEGSESTWYILSKEKGANKLIKLWQNGTNHIKGAIDLSPQLLASLKGEKIAGYNFKDKKIEIFLLGNRNKALVFRDYGFDNSRERAVVSKNINNKNYSVYEALVKELSLSLDSSESYFEKKFSDNLVGIYLGDSLENLEKIKPRQTIKFKGDKRQVFIKMIFYPKLDDIKYSPWLDSINDMAYLVGK